MPTGWAMAWVRDSRHSRRQTGTRTGGLIAGVAITIALVPGVPAGADTARAEGSGRCAAPDGPVEITIWHPLDAALQAAFNDRIAEFNAMQDEIHVVAETQPGYAGLVDRIVDSSRDEMPDIILSNETATFNLAASGATIAPSECPGSEPLDDLLPVVEATYAVDGRLVATPYNVSTPLLVYNAALLEAAGLDPSEPPSTLAELRAASDQIVTSGVATHGFVVQASYGSWFIKQFAAQRGEVIGEPANGRDGEPVSDLTFATPEVAAGFQWLRDGIDDGAFVWIDTSGGGYDDLVRVTTEEADGAFTLHTSASLGDVIAVLEGGDAFPLSRLGAAPLPGGGGQVGGGALWVVDRGDPAAAGAAQEVVDFLTAPSALAALAAATGCVPPRTSVLQEPVLVDAWAAHPELRVGYDQLAEMGGDPAAAGLLALPAREIDELMFHAAYDIIHGPGDPLTALTELEEAGETLLRFSADEG